MPPRVRPDGSHAGARPAVWPHASRGLDAHTAGGIVSGTVEGAEHLRTQIEHAPELTVIDASWASLGGADPRTGSTATIPIDDLLIAVADEDPSTAVHASFHPISLVVGPYLIAG